ncbi:MAG: guanylate kinase [Candidatus Dormibacteraeota bacterium]|nr:guanylate kinase [Candidatus Dormibacteraeota bacterium]
MSEQLGATSAGRGLLIVLSGPSGVGKDTVLRELFQLDPSLHYSVSFTTRRPRPDEEEGRSYSFVDDSTFDAMIAREEFLEWANIFTHRYGTSLERVRDALGRGEDIVLKIDVQGAASVRRRMGGDATFIFLLPPSRDELRRRLVERATEDPDGLERRWDTAVEELAEQDKYDHCVVNDDVRRAAREILGIIQAERAARRTGAGA